MSELGQIKTDKGLDSVLFDEDDVRVIVRDEIAKSSTEYTVTVESIVDDGIRSIIREEIAKAKHEWLETMKENATVGGPFRVKTVLLDAGPFEVSDDSGAHCKYDGSEAPMCPGGTASPETNSRSGSMGNAERDPFEMVAREFPLTRDEVIEACYDAVRRRWR